MKGFIINTINDFLVRHTKLHRFLLYRHPREYWVRRGKRYFEEQEVVPERHARSEYISQKLRSLPYQRVLEIGCGYGKQLRNLKPRPDCLVVGIDWSGPQLVRAKDVCKDMRPYLVEADAAHLPFKNCAFDLILTSAVIMHNPEPQAKMILYEIMRVGRRFVAHNEDTDITFTRHGYDMAKTYTAMWQKILETGPIPVDIPVNTTQFTVVELGLSSGWPASAQDVPIQYHAAATHEV